MSLEVPIVIIFYAFITCFLIAQVFEFDDTNVFSINRFPGIDKIEGGPRVNLGIKYGIYGNNTGSLNILLGQVFRLKADDTFAEKTGLESTRSDYVGRISLSPKQNINYYQTNSGIRRRK